RGAGGAVVLDASRSFGVASAELPSTGNTDRPCVVLDASIDATTVAAVASVDSQNTPTFNTAVATIRVGGEGSQGCPNNSIAIFVRRNDGGGGSDIGSTLSCRRAVASGDRRVRRAAILVLEALRTRPHHAAGCAP